MHAEGPVLINNRRILWLVGKIEPDKSEFDGSFTQGSAARVSVALRRRNYDEVWMNSPGGSLLEGIRIGRMLRDNRATVRVPAMKNVICASACTIAMMGGTRRIVDQGADFRLHAPLVFLEADKPVLGAHCDDAISSGLCSNLLQVLQSAEPCHSEQDFESRTHPCVYAKDQYSSLYIKYLQLPKPDPELQSLKLLTDLRTQNELEETLELIIFYQESIAAGRAATVQKGTYRSFIGTSLPSIYASGPDGGGRSLEKDKVSIRTMGQAAWQEIMTFAIRHSGEVLLTKLKPNINRFGIGADVALKTFEAMSKCYSASGCPISHAQAASLGFHNFDG